MLIFWNFCTYYFHNIQLHGYAIVKLLDPLQHSKVQVKLGKIFKNVHDLLCNCLQRLEVPSANIFRGRLCLISITRGDGTPMDASSISEEDIMEICVKKGHTCPLGVLHYLATESIVLFGTAEDLK